MNPDFRRKRKYRKKYEKKIQNSVFLNAIFEFCRSVYLLSFLTLFCSSLSSSSRRLRRPKRYWRGWRSGYRGCRIRNESFRKQSWRSRRNHRRRGRNRNFCLIFSCVFCQTFINCMRTAFTFLSYFTSGELDIMWVL